MQLLGTLNKSNKNRQFFNGKIGDADNEEKTLLNFKQEFLALDGWRWLENGNAGVHVSLKDYTFVVIDGTLLADRRAACAARLQQEVEMSN